MGSQDIDLEHVTHVGFHNQAPDGQFFMLDSYTVERLIADLQQAITTLRTSDRIFNIIVVLGGEKGYDFVYHTKDDGPNAN